MIKDSTFFHEDNYCQIELLPIQNLFAKLKEADITVLERNFIDNGFVNISYREQTRYPLTNLNIDCNAFKKIFKDDALFYFDKVYTGYSSERLFKNNTCGIGFENYIIYFEFNNNIIIKSWIDYNLLSDTLNCYPKKLQKALSKIGLMYDLILVDWNELRTVNLKNETALINYVKNVL